MKAEPLRMLRGEGGKGGGGGGRETINQSLIMVIAILYTLIDQVSTIYGSR